MSKLLLTLTLWSILFAAAFSQTPPNPDGQSRSIEEGWAVGIHQQLVLGPRTPGLYQAASILKRVNLFGFADIWDSKGRSSLGAPCIWTPVDNMIIYLDLVAESDLEIENGGDR